MKIIVSPSKTMGFNPSGDYPKEQYTNPIFESQANDLNNLLMKADLTLQQDLALSDTLFKKTKSMIASFKSSSKHSAIFSYSGAFYKGLDPDSLSSYALDYAKKHLLILSGHYGVLRPSDQIHPYRLPVGQAFRSMDSLTSLYDYWQSAIYQVLTDEFIINLASAEYAKMLGKLPYTTLDFRIIEKGNLKISSMELKTIRGKMTQYLLENAVQTIEQIKEIQLEGYSYNERVSKPSILLFTKEKNV